MRVHVVVGPTKERPYHLYDDERVTPGWPHGDAWAKMRGFPKSHDTERHAATLRRLKTNVVEDKKKR
jgi:hypothetical protein